MIFPIPEKLDDVRRFPVTTMLVALNILLFLIFFSQQALQTTSGRLLERQHLELAGRVYKEFQVLAPPSLRSSLPDWLLNAPRESLNSFVILGIYSLRDGKFIENVANYKYAGDQVQIERFLAAVGTQSSKAQDQVVNRFGLSTSSSLRQPLTWITYQFAHSNWFHLLSNMAFLMILGCAVEILAGGRMVLGVYLLGGWAGGAAFLGSDSHGMIPVVGASAAVSALMAFYLVAEVRKRVRYFYFFTPFPGGFGHIYLPVLLIFPLYLLSDLSALLSTPTGMGGGVAHVAHLGGSFLGLLAGFIFRVKQNLVLRR